jgi:hypothetical protein
MGERITKDPFTPGRCVPGIARRLTGPLKLIAFSRQHLVTTVIGPHDAC